MSVRSEKITSLGNPRIKNLVKLRSRRARRDQGLTIVEEPLVIERALAAGRRAQAVYVCLDQLNEKGHEVLADLQLSDCPDIFEVPAHVMEKVSYRDNPEGLLIEMRAESRALADLDLPVDALVVVLENVEKPGNLGAILRVADGAGADAVLVTGHGTDLDNPNTLRASRGTVFSVPTIEADAPEILEFLESRGITTIATTPAAENNYTKLDLCGPIALLLGAEDKGLSDRLLNAATCRAAIPMRGAADSLNVAASAALLLYEARRQRDQSSSTS